MQSDRQFTRVNILEIKIQISKKLGNQKAQKYFDLLNRFFSLKLGKSEFNKQCVAIIGRENLCIHNRLIRSILKNAFLSKKPPPKANKVENLGNDDKVANGYQRSCLQSLCRDVLPPSPRKVRTHHGFRDRKGGKDRPSPLGPHGKPSTVTEIMTIPEEESPTELQSLGSRPIEVNSVEDGEEVDQAAISPGIHSRFSPVTPPLGVPWNGKGNRKVFDSLFSSPRVETCHRNGVLPDTNSLKKRLEQKLEKEGMRVSTDCVNLLNNGLDTFLKRLITPSLQLTISRVGNKGLYQMRGQATSTMLDFRTAMELTPQILGEDWPMLLEKVCVRASENNIDCD